MDFIEQLFGISPDGGNGTLEVVWIVALVTAGAAVIWRLRRIAARQK